MPVKKLNSEAVERVVRTLKPLEKDKDAYRSQRSLLALRNEMTDAGIEKAYRKHKERFA